MVKCFIYRLTNIILTLYSWGHHIHYDLEFKGYSVNDSKKFAWDHKSEYCRFGAVAVALELVPLFNMLFVWTNVVGAALWVGDKYEKNEKELAKRNNAEPYEVYVGPKDR